MTENLLNALPLPLSERGANTRVHLKGRNPRWCQFYSHWPSVGFNTRRLYSRKIKLYGAYKSTADRVLQLLPQQSIFRRSTGFDLLFGVPRGIRVSWSTQPGEYCNKSHLAWYHCLSIHSKHIVVTGVSGELDTNGETFWQVKFRTFFSTDRFDSFDHCALKNVTQAL